MFSSRRIFRVRALAVVACLFAACGGTSYAADGTWTLTGNGNWNTAANWSGSIIANGANFTATFNAPLTGTRTITLNSSRTLGNLVFDNDGNTSLGWILQSTNASVLTLSDSTGPTITATTSASINMVLAGTQGFLVTGEGAVYLNGANTYSGNVTVQNGTLQALDGVGLSSAANLVLSTGGVFQTTGSFTRSIGTGAGQFQGLNVGVLSGNGNLTIDLGGAGQTLTWGQNGFLGDGISLNLRHTSSSSLTKVSFINPIDLAGGSRTFHVSTRDDYRGDRLEFTGQISNGSVSLTGGGVAVFTAANTYSGTTTVLSATLQAIDGIGLPTASNLTLKRGTFESSGTFTRSLGTGAGQVQWVEQGGFSAHGGPLTVNLGGAGQTVVWGQNGFVPDNQLLTFGSAGQTHTTTFVNPIDLNGGHHTVSVNSNSANYTVDVELTGVISNGSFGKGDYGLLQLSGLNTYSGGTTIWRGFLRAVDGVGLPTAGNLTIDADFGGLETAGTFSRQLGAGSGEVRWKEGGFAAVGGDLTINLGGAGQTLVWNSASFINATEDLSLGSPHSNGKTTLVNALDLNGGSETIRVYGSLTSDNDFVEISGAIGNGGVEFVGNSSSDGNASAEKSRLVVLTGNNTVSSLTVGVELRAAQGVGLPNSANLALRSSGVYETSGSFTRSLGTGPGEVRIGTNGGGGFAAYGGPLTVNLGGAGQTVVRGANHFLVSGAFSLNGYHADARVTFVNPIDAAGGTLAVGLYDNPYSDADEAELAGVISNGVLSVNSDGEGRLILTGNNTYGNTSIFGGTLQLGDGGASGSAGTGNIGGANGHLSVKRSDVFALPNLISGANKQFRQLGTGTTVLSGSNAYGGGTTIVAGVLQVAHNSALGTGGVVIQNGGRLDVSSGITISNPITFSAGGILSGNGTVASNVSVSNGGILSPGNSPGTLHFTGLIEFGPGGRYTWEINDVDAGAGVFPGWDLIDIADQLMITATAGAKYQIDVTSLTLADAAGAVHDFDPAQSYDWIIATAGGGITGFDANFFQVNTSSFANSFDGSFSLVQSGNGLFLHYSAVPEPGSCTLAALAAVGWYVRSRRRRLA